MNNVWLGIDTSNYTTSVSAVDDVGTYFNIKLPLCVKQNEKGIRQSEAVFMHIKNIPEAMKQLSGKLGSLGSYTVCAVGVSTRPRSVEGSYMPCFLSGVSVAAAVSSMLNIPMYEFSHQEGHIRAGLFGANSSVPEKFYAFHLSGGTCEFLSVKKEEFGFSEKIIAETADITLGQLVDRTGVMLGLKFPCGAELEKLALQSSKKHKVKINGDCQINLSGFENKIQKMFSNGEEICDIAAFVYEVIISAIEKMLICRSDVDSPVLFAGGVSGSGILQSRVGSLCNALFAPSSLASDNAVGIALLTKEKYLKVKHE